MNDISVPAGAFKATCLKLMDEVAATGKSVTITKRGRAVARLVPVPISAPKSLFGSMAGTVQILGDIVSPSSEDHFRHTLEEWDENESVRTKRTKAKRK